MSELRFDQVSVRYGRGRNALTAVDQVSLLVPSGKVVGLVGESGSGKSTLARTSVGLAPISAGRVSFGDTDLSVLRRQGKYPLQMIFQDPYGSLNPRMTIGECIAETMPRGRRSSRGLRRAEARRLLELVNLEPATADALPGRLSGGQRQRVALARALAGKPSVIVADEITSALDVSVQGSVLNTVRELQRELSLGMLFISHNLAVVRYVSDFIAVMYLGRVVEAGPAEEILANPRHPYTQELLLAAAHEDSLLGDLSAAPIGAVEPADPHRPPAGCRFHPRCPIGPALRTDREICATVEPLLPVVAGPAAACHFSAELRPATSN
ncbi:MAG: ABC transporter ATP-binding protein [Actinomycetota bacterium]|nr:ABC transporter ATP-binding protein [Actinomycetota bacterium]